MQIAEADVEKEIEVKEAGDISHGQEQLNMNRLPWVHKPEDVTKEEYALGYRFSSNGR